MLISKDVQEAMLENYINNNHTTDECIGFIDGMEAMMELVNKIMLKK